MASQSLPPVLALSLGGVKNGSRGDVPTSSRNP